MTSVGSGKKLVIIGSGIIGLCCAFHLLRQDWEITVVSSDPADDTTACGSAGAIAIAQVFPASEPGLWLKVPRWLVDPLGPLSIRPGHMPKLTGWLVKFLAAGTEARVEASTRALASLMAPARDHHFELIKEINAQDLLRQSGNLWLYHSERSRDKDAKQWAMRKQLGIEFSTVDREQILEREPALGPGAHCGYFIPDWCHYIDPQALLATLANYLRNAGVTFVQDTVGGFEISDGHPTAALGAQGNKYNFNTCLVAAGAHSARLSAQLGDGFPLESERGYNTMLPNTGLDIKTFLTFEEHFALTPIAQGLRIGGAAEFAGLDAPPNYARSKALLKLVRRYLPDLNDEGGTQWMGHRPAAPDSLPVIGRSTGFSNIYYGFGHGHIGLTLGPTTGRLISQLIGGESPEIPLSPFAIDRYS